MDKEQEELQFIGFFGIWKKSFKTIYAWRQIFIQLTLTLILPLSFIYFAHTEINYLLTQNMSQILLNMVEHQDDPSAIEAATRALSREVAWYLLFQVSYIVFLLICSLLSTSAVVYTVACIYVGKTVSFKQVMRVIPKVWKRLVVTLLCIMAIMFIYNCATFFVVFITLLVYPVSQNNIEMYIIPGAIFCVLYLAGVCYMGVVWQIANVISVLEESYGFQALRKSKTLMKGKMGISVGIFLIVNLCVGGAMQLFNNYVVFHQSHEGMFGRIGFGMMCLLVLCITKLVGFVVQTELYLVCKSYHHERIDKSALADHLEVYHGEGYVLLKPKDEKMEQV